MKKIKVLLFIVSVLVCSGVLKAQTHCLADSVLHTDSLGNYVEKFKMPLTFKVTKDSIHVLMTNDHDGKIMAFRIIKKDKCEWNNDFTSGITSYKAMVETKANKMEYPTINIVYKTTTLRYIEVLYENDEPRVFSIKR